MEGRRNQNGAGRGGGGDDLPAAVEAMEVARARRGEGRGPPARGSGGERAARALGPGSPAQGVDRVGSARRGPGGVGGARRGPGGGGGDGSGVP